MEDSGYVSEEARQRFGRDMGIASLVACGLAMVSPFLLMLLFSPGLFLPRAPMDFPDLGSGAWWRGRLFYPAGSRILSVGFAGEPRTEVSDAGHATLLASPEILWVLAGSRLGRLENGAVQWLTSVGEAKKVSHPFLVDGAPAVLAEAPGGAALRVWRDGGWQEQAPLAIPTGAERFHVGCTAPLWAQGRLFVFLDHDDGYWLEVGEDARWRRLPGSSEFSPLLWNGAPGFAAFEDGDLVIRTLVGSVFAQQLSVPVSGAQFGVHAWPDGPDSLILARTGFFDQLSLERIRDGKVTASAPAEGPSLFGGFFAGMVAASVAAVLIPLGLALFASSRMARDRVGVFSFEGRQWTYAPVFRRALAQVLDGAIGGAPCLVAYWFLFLAFQELPEYEALLRAGLGLLAAVAWSFLVMLVFSWSEGSTGRTPGKWLAGIRVVGTDLRPCGFFRALLRNLLRMADGMWYYLPALVFVAFSKQWQRLGDLVGRTLVIRDEPRDLAADAPAASRASR